MLIYSPRDGDYFHKLIASDQYQKNCDIELLTLLGVSLISNPRSKRTYLLAIINLIDSLEIQLKLLCLGTTTNIVTKIVFCFRCIWFVNLIIIVFP